MPQAATLSVLDVPHKPTLTPFSLTSGHPDLDALQPVRPGRVTLLSGDADGALYNYIASATRSGTVLAIDGGNHLDAYAIVEAGSRLGMASDEALTRVYVARAFTPYQMEALVERVLPQWLLHGPPPSAPRADSLSLVVINDLAEQYLDEDTPQREGDKLHKRALRKIREYASTYRLNVPLILSTTRSARDERAHAFARLQRDHADDAVILAPARPNGPRRILVPTRGATLLSWPAWNPQRAIDDWLEPRAPVQVA
jgi:hypothetical protein